MVDTITANLDFESGSFRTELSGTGPFVGKFSATLQGISMRGSLVFTPVNDARILLFSFTERPDINVKLAIRGPFIGTQTIPQFSFLRSLIIDAIETDFVQPNHGMIPLVRPALAPYSVFKFVPPKGSQVFHPDSLTCTLCYAHKCFCFSQSISWVSQIITYFIIQ